MIKNKFIADGMDVPDIYNDANMLQNFPNGPADIYGWDNNYPAGFDCRTSWGDLSKPSVYTSYDDGLAISEPGLMTTKAYENKLQAEVDKSDIILVDDRAATETSTKDAKLLVADYNFNSQHLVYSTSEIFTHQDVGSHDSIVVYAYKEEEGEFAIKVKNDNELTYTHPNGTTSIYISDGTDKDLLVLIAGYDSALRWWAPYIDAKKSEGAYLVLRKKPNGSMALLLQRLNQILTILRYHTGNIWFRDHFNDSSEITDFNLTAHSGSVSAWIVHLNSHCLGGFDVGTRKRGFTQAELSGVSNQTIWSIDWKIQGNLGSKDLADTVRGTYNEDGLYGERNGWHLPCFSDDDWEDMDIPGNQNHTAVSWYRTTFDANIPDGYDVPTQFYLSRGILNTDGENTLAIVVIPVNKATQIGQITLEPYDVLQSALPQVEVVESPNLSRSSKKK
ncbi:hypothetical protein INT45_001217 [Circinella minor]|uniref:Beta-galactosidase domain-containing protein n=1 Tax=Circinella minor TaxID=1195481 RepID=A0A8H7S4L8_9FUNG|nr:hypothetical protein INT45_001217 [Circinella minor]